MTDVRQFVEDEEWAAGALAAVLERAEAGDGTVRWRDVDDDLDSTEWGALVERGLLVDAGGAFVVDDPVAVREALDEVPDVPTPDVEHAATPGADPAGDAASDDGREDVGADEDEAGWSTADRAAAVGAVVLMSGYHVAGIRNAVGASLDVVLGPIEAVAPFPAVVLLLAVVTAAASTLLRRRLVDDDPGTERVTEIREEIAAARERGDEEAVERLVDEQTSLMLSTFKTQLRPLAWTMLVSVPVFLWLYWVTLSPTQAVAPVVTVLPHLGDVVWTAKVVGPMKAWMLWYVACSLSAGAAVRRSVARFAGE